jgi:hypothetical protein
MYEKEASEIIRLVFNSGSDRAEKVEQWLREFLGATASGCTGLAADPDGPELERSVERKIVIHREPEAHAPWDRPDDEDQKWIERHREYNRRHPEPWDGDERAKALSGPMDTVCPVCSGRVGRRFDGTLCLHKRYVDGGGSAPGQDHTLVPCEGGTEAPQGS